MSTWKEIVQRYHIKHHNQTSKVTKPIVDHFDVGMVNYLKIFHDGKFVFLSNRPECIEYYIDEKAYCYDPFLKHPDILNSGFYWEETTSDDNKNFFRKISNKYDLHHPLVLIVKKTNCVEMISFSGLTNVAIQELYLKHSQLLTSFAEYYKKELGSLIRQMEDEGFTLIDLIGTSFHQDIENPSEKNDAIRSFLIALGKQAEFERAASLSNRERECLKLLIHGNSAKDSAVNLKLSPRTVEFYLENVKNKLNCFSKHELFSIGTEFQDLGLI